MSSRFFPHAEGRVLRFANTTSGAVRYAREFTIKDHLGNLRLAYRLGQHRTYAAPLEQDATTHGRESQQFDSLSVSPPVAPARGPAPPPLGPLTQLTVQKGDTIGFGQKFGPKGNWLACQPSLFTQKSERRVRSHRRKPTVNAFRLLFEELGYRFLLTQAELIVL